jgi:hypothetical protein
MRCGLSAARASARRMGVTEIGKKKGKGLCAQLVALGCRYILLGLNMSTILQVSARVSNRRGRNGESRSREEGFHSRLKTTVRAPAEGASFWWW